MVPIIAKGEKQQLAVEDVLELSNGDDCRSARLGFAATWGPTDPMQRSAADRARPRSGWAPLLRLIAGPFAVAACLAAFGEALQFVLPMMLQWVVTLLEGNGSIDPGQAAIAVVVLCLSPSVSSVCLAHQLVFLQRCGIRMHAAFAGMVYAKALRLAPGCRANTGTIVSLVSTDAATLARFGPEANRLWTHPIVITVALILLFQALGISALAGLLTNIAMFPMYAVIGASFSSMYNMKLAAQDDRMKLLTQIITGIRIVKAFTWEPGFKDRVAEVRERELKAVFWTQMNQSALVALIIAAPMLSSLATFVTYSLLGNVLTPSVVFTSVALFGLIRVPMMELPMSLATLLQANVSVKRLATFLSLEEMRDMSQVTGCPEPELHVRLDKASFTWAPQEELPKHFANADAPSGSGPRDAALKDISITIPRGKLTCIVGRVASGKSSLLSAIIGELRQTAGLLQVDGPVAYVAQQAMIFNATVRDNILFGLPYDETWYEAVVDAAALKADFATLIQGDQTEIGERGINLSGGQKQRISIARALYRRLPAGAGLYLLDDPLSAVDVHVGQHLVEKVILGLMAGRTRVLVTNQLQYLPYADQILVMADGKIAHAGTYDQLMADGIRFDQLAGLDESDEEGGSQGEASGENNEDAAADIAEAAQNAADVAAIQTAGEAAQDTVATTTSAVDAGQVMLKEPHARARSSSGGRARAASNPRRRASSETRDKKESKVKEETKKDVLVEDEGRADGKVTWRTYRAYFRHVGGTCFLIILIMAYILSQIALVGSDYWLSVWSSTPDAMLTLFVLVYAGWIVLHVILIAVKGGLLSAGSVRASRLLHENLLSNVIRAPARYFDQTPTGRLLNRFGRDMESIDGELTQIMNTYYSITLMIITQLVAMAVAVPWFTIFLLPILGLYYITYRSFAGGVLNVNRLEAVTRSPVYQAFAESLNGISTLMAYKVEPMYQANVETTVNAFHRAWFTSQVAQFFMILRLGQLGALVVGGMTLVVVLSAPGPGYAGLGMAYSFQLVGLFGFAVLLSTLLEVRMNNVDRVLEYTRVEQEPPDVIETNRPPAGWPASGKVEFVNFSLRYRPNLPQVLRSVNLTIEGGEKIGIVGRTGAGKSSLVTALLRLYDGEGGTILIDGVDINAIGVKDLRHGVELIPQEPTLFIGTVRSNLDMFNEFTDEQVWEALERVGMKATIASSDAGLKRGVEPGGTNFSLGERQLMCLARTLIRRPKVLIMDESTASVDKETDHNIQATVRQVFADATVLVIAHRLNTIMDSDKVLVLKDGQVAEFASPAQLLRNPDSLFTDLVNGADNPAELRAIADHAEKHGWSNSS